jgi:transposase
LQTTISPQTERMARLEDEAGGFVLLPNVPPTGDLAPSARDSLTVYKDQHGTEQNYGLLQDPVLVNSLFLKKPARSDALGLLVLLALLLWRLMERTMRVYGATTSPPLPGWDKQATARPTAFMMVTTFAGVLVLQCGHARQLVRPLSVVQQQYLTALDVPATWFTLPAGSQRTPMAARRLSRRHKQVLPW